MKKIILASKSPRRRDILTRIGVPFEVIESNVEEKIDVDNSPYEWVSAISEKKAKAVAAMVSEECVIIGADTIITDLGKILQKPKDKNDAHAMLKELQGHKHTVYTGVTLIFKDANGSVTEQVSLVDATDVFMRSLTDEEIDTYISTEEAFDKAGAYAIQGKGAILIEQIDGDYYTVVGLPIYKLYMTLKEHGVDLMDAWR